MSLAQSRESLRRNAVRVRDQIQEIVNDIEWWNANRTDAPPFDVGADKVAIRLAEQHIAELDSGVEPIPSETLDKLIAQLKAIDAV